MQESTQKIIKVIFRLPTKWHTRKGATRACTRLLLYWERPAPLDSSCATHRLNGARDEACVARPCLWFGHSRLRFRFLTTLGCLRQLQPARRSGTPPAEPGALSSPLRHRHQAVEAVRLLHSSEPSLSAAASAAPAALEPGASASR